MKPDHYTIMSVGSRWAVRLNASLLVTRLNKADAVRAAREDGAFSPLRMFGRAGCPAEI